MSHDLTFRVILVVLAVVLYVNHHIIHRRPSVRRRSASGQGLHGVELWLVCTASFWTLTLGLYATGFRWFDISVQLPDWSRWLGVAMMIACAPLSQWIYHELGAQFSKKLELNEEHQLIRSGPYRFVRHPMYATLFLCAIATCLISANCLVMLSVISVAIVFLIRMRKEEAMLIQRFGDQYREYSRQTWALVPRFGTLG